MNIGGSDGGNGKIIEAALQHYEAELPAVISSYMKGENLSAEYRGIAPYVREVRSRLIEDAGGELSQLQMVVLDGICETLLILKFISTFIGENPETQIIQYNKMGTPQISDVAIRGFGNFHTILDKKIKQFHDMTAEQKNALSPQEVHRRAVMGEGIPTGRPKSNDRRLKENRDFERGVLTPENSQ